MSYFSELESVEQRNIVGLAKFIQQRFMVSELEIVEHIEILSHALWDVKNSPEMRRRKVVGIQYELSGQTYTAQLNLVDKLGEV